MCSVGKDERIWRLCKWPMNSLVENGQSWNINIILTVWKSDSFCYFAVFLSCCKSFWVLLWKYLGYLVTRKFFMETDLLILSCAFVQFFSINSQRKENKPADATFNVTRVICKIISMLFTEANKSIWFLKNRVADTLYSISTALIFNGYRVRWSFWEPLH